MAELRYHPFIDDWVMIASNRQNRPQMPKDYCPFCPGSGKVPDHFTVYDYPNDFPALSQDPPVPDDVATDFFKTRESYGKCEVILYSPNHTATLPDLSDAHMRELVDLWTERFEALSADKKIKYVFVFENRGELVGVTMPHPHGQIYGYSVVPKKIQLECENAKKHLRKTGNCLFCDFTHEEQRVGERIIFENEHFVVVLPFFCEYPYGVYVMAKRHVGNISEMTDAEKDALGVTVKQVAGMYDSLFDFRFPYMMCMHNAPVNGEDCSDYYHFHIEFYPPMRSATKQKFNASSETGAWAHCNPTAPEEKAAELREAYARFIEREKNK